ncbi:MAG: GNAT family protein [Rhizobiaceae bacterium]
MSEDLSNWEPRPRPERNVLEGRYVRLEPLSAAKHGDELFDAASILGEEDRFLYLPEYPPSSREEFQLWVELVEKSEDPLFFAVIDKRTGKVEGRQTLMRIDPANGVIEIGNIFWGGRISRTPATTEALYLFAKYIFEDLGYRRFEWKCNNDNKPSIAAALRYGFTAESVFRQALIVKGKNRDTAWFSMLGKEWPAVKKMFEAWLDPSNFDADGQQKEKLQEIS